MIKRLAKISLASAIVSLTLSLSAHADTNEAAGAAINAAGINAAGNGAEYQAVQTTQISPAASFKVQQGLGAAIGFTALPDLSTLKMLLSSSVLGSLYIISRRRK